MLRWDTIEPVKVNGKYIKMYRSLFQAEKSIKIDNPKLAIDHLAYKAFGTELEQYKLVDTNAIALIENRLDFSRLKTVNIPIQEKL